MSNSLLQIRKHDGLRRSAVSSSDRGGQRIFAVRVLARSPSPSRRTTGSRLIATLSAFIGSVFIVVCFRCSHYRTQLLEEIN
jgi:hypothetical protein